MDFTITDGRTREGFLCSMCGTICAWENRTGLTDRAGGIVCCECTGQPKSWEDEGNEEEFVSGVAYNTFAE